MRCGRFIAAVGACAWLAGCGGTSSPQARPAATSAQSGALAALPVGSPSSVLWVAGRLPAGYVFDGAGDNHGPNGTTVHSSGYGKATTWDRSDIPLQLDTAFGPQALPRGQATTVRGHRAVLAHLTDDGQPFGVSLSWHERTNLTMTVSAHESLTVADARLVAAHVKPVSSDTWRRLIIASSDPDGRVVAGMPRVIVSSGSTAGTGWTMTALLPPNFPVLALDRRAACYELEYRGERSTGSACFGHPSWIRLGGQVFVFGEASPDVRRVVVRSGEGAAVFAAAQHTPRWAGARFWVAPMPTATCSVTVEPVDHAATSAPRTLGSTGPLDEQPVDQRRCAGAPSPPRPRPRPTVPGETSVVSAPAPPPPPPPPPVATTR